MDIKEIEKKLVELKGKQSDVFKKKKAERNLEELAAVREEMNDLKAQAREAYKARKKEKKQIAHQERVEATKARKAGK